MDIEPHTAIISHIAYLTNLPETVALKQFVQLILSNTECTGGLYKGTQYSQISNSWGGRERDSNGLECGGYETCELLGKINKIVNYADVLLTWNFYKRKDNKLFDDTYIRCSECHDDMNKCTHKMNCILNIPEAKKFMETLYDARNVKLLEGGVKLEYNLSDERIKQVLSDHRGSTHCLINLPQQSTVVLNNPTLSEFIEAICLTRYNKFDLYYEEFGCKKVEMHGEMFFIDFY